MESRVIPKALQIFQLDRLRRAFFCKRIAATPDAHRLTDRCVASLYRACVEAGVRSDADELCAQYRQVQAHEEQENPAA